MTTTTVNASVNAQVNAQVFVKSIFIPHIHDIISMNDVVNILEIRYKLGTVGHMECIPKVNQKDGHKYYTAFVFFSTWSASEAAKYLDYQFQNGHETKMYYDDDKKYWMVMQNTSDLQNSVTEQPKHMSIVTYIPAEISFETIASVVEGLDLGQVHGIYDDEISENSSYTSHTTFPGNPKMTEKMMQLPVRTVTIHFDYWYRTRSAIAFQKEMETQQYVDVRTHGGALLWSFYSSLPITEGINPHVFHRIQA